MEQILSERTAHALHLMEQWYQVANLWHARIAYWSDKDYKAYRRALHMHTRALVAAERYEKCAREARMEEAQNGQI